MHLSLVHTRTQDNIRLDGLLNQPGPSTQQSNPWPVDLVVFVHGTSGNFYQPGILEHFEHTVANSGTNTLRINTRGHDGLVGQQGGAALEHIDDCRLDLDAWFNWAQQHNSPRILLVGHSMGGIKSIYATAAHTVNPLAIIAISPPRFCHSMYQQHPAAGPFREDYLRATQLVSAGRGDELIEVRQPLPIWIRASGFIEKYGPDDRYDLLRHLPQVTCPVLVQVGGQTTQQSPAFNSLADDLQSLQLPPSRLTVQVIPDADMHYSNDPDEPVRQAADWFSDPEDLDPTRD